MAEQATLFPQHPLYVRDDTQPLPFRWEVKA